MKPINQLHFRVCDKGLFLPVARRLAREAGKVTYWTPADRAFPTVWDNYGDGFDDIERVGSFLDNLATVDCFVFPDIGFAEIQRQLRESGYPVWGHMGADELEVMRGKFLDELEKIDLPVPKHERITGMSMLRKHLQDKEDLWIKVSRYRGDWETFHWRSYKESYNELDEKSVRLGPFAEQTVFFVFDPIESTNEDGCDTHCIDGRVPSLVIHGMEAKDKAYIGTFQKFDELPEEVRVVMEAFAPSMGRYGCRSFFSCEVRITEQGDSFFIDPTIRAGSPPSQCQTEMIENYAEMIWGGANGELIEPVPAFKFGVQAHANFDRNKSRWSYVKSNSDLDQWIKCGNCMFDDGVICLPPDLDDSKPDWVIGVGDTLDEAIQHLKGNIDELPDGATCEFETLTDILKQIREAESDGMRFTDQDVPKPESLLKD